MNLIGRICVLLVLCATAPALAQRNNNLPYRFATPDPFGNTWMIYPGGQLIQQGPMPFSTDMASINISGQQISQPVQQVRIEANGEVVLQNLRGSNFNLTRRFLQTESGVIRIIDVIRNTRPQESSFVVTLNSTINFGVQSSRPLADARSPDKSLGAVISDPQGRTGLRVFAGKGSKLTPNVNATPQSNQVQGIYELKVPAGKEVAIVHFCAVTNSEDAAEKLFGTLREARILANVPEEVRNLIVNYATSSGGLDELELLRGGLTDVVELTNGDQLKGDLLMETWEIQTPFGQVKIPQEQLAGYLVTPGIRPRQLLVSSDGEVIGGRLVASTVPLQFAGGQRIELPVEQIAKIGRRSNMAGPTTAESRAFRPMVHLRAGDRIAVQLPQEPLMFATRFGQLPLPADRIARLDLQPENSSVHMAVLSDGSRFGGVLLGGELTLMLARGGEVKLTPAMVRQLVFAPDPQGDEPAAVLRLTGDDVVAAELAQRMVMTTAYGEVTVNGAEVKRIVRVPETLDDIQVTLWDDSAITGQVASSSLPCTLAGGIQALVPVAAIESYSSTRPQPAAQVVERIAKLVSELNADDWKQRQRAEASLIELGESIVPVLNQLRGQQPPEAQQRIDTILRKLGQQQVPAPAARPGVPAIEAPLFIQ